QARLHLLAAMGQFCGPNDLARRVVDQCQASNLTTGIELHAQRLWLGSGYRALEDDGEGRAAPDGGLPTSEQPPRPRRMARRQRAPLGIYDEHKRHLNSLLSVALSGTPLARVMVSSTRLWSGFRWQRHCLLPRPTV